MKKEIKIGYEVGTGDEVSITPSHLIVTGVTQLSGKTTTLEALIKRSGLKAIVFRTKVGEKSFTEGTVIPPYFKEVFNWEEAANLLEASRKEKLKFERSWIIRYSKGAGSLIEFKRNIDEALVNDKLRGLDRSVLITLQAYLEKILPELQYANFSRILELRDGINIMNLESFKEETQSLIIKSVMTTVLKEYKRTIVVIPEAWTFLPQKRGSPCKLVVEKFIRQGATNNNYLWFDSQDITQIDKTPLKQVSIWVLGLQTELNEIKRTLDQVPAPKSSKPKPNEIATLSTGHFFLCTPKFIKRIYVQPYWLDDETAKQIALGKKDVDEVEKPQTIGGLTVLPQKVEPLRKEVGQSFERYQQDIVELRHDFFTKLSEVKELFNKELIGLKHDFFAKMSQSREALTELSRELINLKMSKSEQPLINEDELISKLLQKMPVSNNVSGSSIDKEEIISAVLARVPKGVGAVTYEVMPLEKIKKDFLEEAKSKVINDVQGLTPDEKKVLKYIESRACDVSTSELVTKCFHLKQGGSTSVKVSKIMSSLKSIEVAEKSAGGRNKPRLKNRIKELLSVHDATDQEVEQVYNHIINELIVVN